MTDEQAATQATAREVRELAAKYDGRLRELGMTDLADALAQLEADAEAALEAADDGS